ncbi:class IV adenylate cyclase [Promethearchaeum syntrophicum]|uniref:Class IV adenylate cyclase n=1 Tax=Promethearchaeum syntrophicum TaxID=2594042 RepID=A0A5B9D8R0_9ARCH|nr:class IV adenylate cyclase [Candidatus Prometheoarchaeum syntrophicum]QEE15453.1 CYTH domain protein [Candidatus Prometheoarchaeum syntrophicum]
MLEIETKIKIDNIILLKKKLEKFNAKNCAILDQIDTYYNYPVESRDFSKTDEALRLRKTTESDPITLKKLKEVVDLTYKGPNLDKEIKTRIEHVCHVIEAEKIEEILKALSFKDVISINKHREVFELNYNDNKIEVLIDIIENLPGSYFEAEILVKDDKMIEYYKNVLFSFIQECGYSKKDILPDTYLEMVLEKIAKKY